MFKKVIYIYCRLFSFIGYILIQPFIYFYIFIYSLSYFCCALFIMLIIVKLKIV